MGYDFKIEYKLGKDNEAADALSRMFFMAWSEPQAEVLQELRQQISDNGEFQKIIQECAQYVDTERHYSVKHNLLYWKGRLVIPEKSSLIQKILKEYHSSPIGGHAGVARTIARIIDHFYCPGLKNDVRDYVQKCVVCHQAKSINSSLVGLLQPLPIPNQVWEDVAMDFITGLPNSFGFTVIMVVVDRLTKYAHFVAMKTDYTSKSVAKAFMTNIVKLHGIPKSIVSDRDKVFTKSFWQHLFKLHGTTLAMSTAYHPQSEALNKCLEMYLRCFTFDGSKGWFKMLAWAEYWYNSAYHNSLGMSPFQA